MQDEHDDLGVRLPHDDADSDAREPLANSDLSGVVDADELLGFQLEERDSEVCLEVETGPEEGLDASTLVDADDPLAWHDDGPTTLSHEEHFDDAAGLDGTDAEDGWTRDSECDGEPFLTEFDEDVGTEGRDDGGLEGVEAARGAEDFLDEGLDDAALPPLQTEEQDDASMDELEQELLRELVEGV